MALLPGVLGYWTLRRTVQVRLGSNTLRLPAGTPIYFALAALRSVPQAGSQFRGLATGIHEISGLDICELDSRNCSHCSLRNDRRLALCESAEQFEIRHFVEGSDMVYDCIRKVASPELYG